ncbi:MAG: hypothetical protein VYD57_09655 [Pseudomonadota bacterium]|nr:hypothetical protein [Pseudomonadota bacterium]
MRTTPIGPNGEAMSGITRRRFLASTAAGAAVVAPAVALASQKQTNDLARMAEAIERHRAINAKLTEAATLADETHEKIEREAQENPFPYETSVGRFAYPETDEKAYRKSRFGDFIPAVICDADERRTRDVFDRYGSYSDAEMNSPDFPSIRAERRAKFDDGMANAKAVYDVDVAALREAERKYEDLFEKANIAEMDERTNVLLEEERSAWAVLIETPAATPEAGRLKVDYVLTVKSYFPHDDRLRLLLSSDLNEKRADAGASGLAVLLNSLCAGGAA